MSKAPRLMASYFTLAGNVIPLAGEVVSPWSLEDRARAAAQAGFVGIGLITQELDGLVARLGWSGIKNVVRDAGLKYIEVEVLLDWFTDGERRKRSDADRAKLLTAAEKLGLYQIKCGGDISGSVWPVERMTEEFTRLSRQVGDAGSMITVEMFPASNIRDLKTAFAVVSGANPQHGGVLLDIWHVTRGNIPYADIATVPAQYIRHIELDDGTKELVGTIMEDTLLRRKAPGDGEWDVPGYLAAIQATGFDGLYGVEILSDDWRKLSLDEAARRAYGATMREFAKVPQRG